MKTTRRTFVATAAAVDHVGAVPVLCDCGPDHMIDVASAEGLVTERTRAIMPVQLNGERWPAGLVALPRVEFRLFCARLIRFPR